MDYGDGKLRGDFQFNRQTRGNEMCRALNTHVNRCGGKFVKDDQPITPKRKPYPKKKHKHHLLPPIPCGQKSELAGLAGLAGLCDWPWHLTLRAADASYVGIHGPSDAHFCGASLISEEWAVTAAHCTYGKSVDDFYVVMGDTQQGSQDPQERVSRVRYIVNHPNYSESAVDYDFSLLQLESPAPVGDCIRSVCLP